MPALTLPLSFTNSFWSQDYRRGLEVLFSKLDQGIAENREIINFIRSRIAIENTTGTALINPPLTGPQGAGFGADDGASLMMAFLGLKAESKAQGEAHKAIARELEDLVVDPFSAWAEEHASRITDAKRTMLDNWLRAYEQEVADVQKLKANYQAKARRADEAEDDAKFAPNNDYGDHYTPNSPRVNQFNGAVKRTASVSERIAQRLKDLRKGVADKTPETEKSILWDGQDSNHSHPTEGGEEEQTTPKIDKGKGRAIDPLPDSPTPMDAPLPPPKQASKPTLTVPSSMMASPDPVPMMIADVPMLPGAVSALLIRAEEELPLRPVRFPILGEYPDCFTGEEFVNFLKDAVPGFLGDLERAEDAAIDLTERENLLRRVGELGNEFENSREAFYQFRRKAFELHIEPPSPAESNKSPVALLSGSNAFANLVMKTIGTGGPQQPPHVKARADAQAADDQYRAAVRKLDRQRLGLEDEIERTLKNLQRWEIDRLSAVKTVLLQFHGTLSNLPTGLHPSFERSSTLIASYQPESDLKALIERYRTGPFRPVTHTYEAAAHEGSDVVFGIDLRKWAGQAGWNDIKLLQVEGAEPEDKDTVPPVVVGLLSALKEAYAKLETPAERRKTWIYEVPLPAVHYLREVCNSFPPHDTIPAEVLQKYDAPVLASAVKLWMLELDPPLCLWEGWDEIRKIYPSVGASAERDEAQLITDLSTALGRFPRIHLIVLDAIIAHLKELIDETADDEEEEEVYVTKLALSVGRSVLRPKVETEMSIQDRHPTLFFIDLINHYEDVLPPTIAKKKRDLERPVPSRKRTALVDTRLSRSSISGGGADVRQLLEAREAQIAEVSRSRPTSPAPQRTSFGIPPPPPPLPQKPVVTPASPPVPTPAGGRPAFVDPVDDDEEHGAEPGPVVVSPPTPQRPQSPISPPRAQSPPGPTSDEDKNISHSQSASLSRSGSGDASRVRGPRTLATKGPRPLSSTPTTATTRTTSGHAPHRSSISSSDGLLAKADPNDYAPKRRGGRVQAGAFSRRTMASDAEDEVTDK